ncbi:heavy metal sensor histidine kinase [Paraburkholderia sp. UCT2]|uniref:heavy metal sensor histidine kinase n=1 Tax=Paraburkholderia sp. UCT2 TaxID=2615208 RepID=UPI00165511C8|nr:heavy metal sensor histidine kinase [Paraburkholderia sp. UCT2]MBC8728779.1 heavy metal sensor histidine kinase [Paraburkholderia sp. UCT2]
MRVRSLAATLALAFGATTLAVFVLVGSFLYLALEKQIKTQDNLDIVLAARHARRLAEELETSKGIREHSDRLISIVLGNQAMSMEVFDPDANRAVEHNIAETFAVPNAASGAATLAALPPLARVADSARITEADIGEWTGRNGAPIRGILTDARLRDGETASVLVARNMSDRWLLLDRYRDKLHMAGVAGVILAMLLGYLLIRAALRPLRDIAASAGLVTVNRLHTRITVARVPSELEALVVSLNAMLARVDHGFQRLSRFTADLAHDMRTPLSNMRGAAEVALARPRSVDEYESLLASNLEECDRLSRMIENVLFLARAEHPQFVKHMREFDAAQELSHIAEYFEGIAEEALVRVRVSGAASLTADLELFRRAVSNLLANAIRYTPQGGEIVLDASASADAVRVTVSNEGQPIAAEHLDRIFDRFYRIDPSRSSLPSSGLSRGSTGSTGLGLAIVRTIMELHGGSVHAQSDARSTRFVLVFRRGG